MNDRNPDNPILRMGILKSTPLANVLGISRTKLTDAANAGFVPHTKTKGGREYNFDSARFYEIKDGVERYIAHERANKKKSLDTRVSELEATVASLQEEVVALANGLAALEPVETGY